jgi:Zn-dependent protease with chaperone function
MQGDLAITQAVFWLARSPYSSALEEEADRLGASYMHATGYSIFQSVRMWETQVSRFASSDSTEGDGGLLGGLLEVAVGEIDNLISSHPNAGRRACQLEQVAHDRFEEEPLERVYVGQTNLQRQEPMADKTY